MKQRLLLCLLLFLSACSTQFADPVVMPTVMAGMQVIPDTPTPTVAPSPTPTRRPSEALQAYTIQGLREHQYQSGQLVIRKILLETEHFTRYLIEYPSDGLTITGILQVPTVGKPPYPVIVLNHGFYSRTLYASGDGTDRAAEFFNRRGYLTVSSDYRTWGASQSGESLFYSGLVIDVINLMDALSSFPDADLERIAMWGHSMGAGVTLKTLTVDTARHPGRIKAAVLYSPVSGDFADLIERWGFGCQGDVLQGEQEYGCNSSDILPDTLPNDLLKAYFSVGDNPALIKAVSPIAQLSFVNAPVQIAYGTEDGKTSAGTPPEWAIKIHTAFQKAGKSSSLFAHTGQGHSFLYDEWYAFMFRSSQFFEANLPLKASP